jgi:hypothetical protein
MIDQSLRHWATLPPEELAPKLVEKFDDFEQALLHRDLDRMQLATYAYYGCDEDGNQTSRIGKKGEQDQLRYVMDNEYRSALRNKLTIATAEPSAFKPVPSNSDSDSQASVVLGRAVLDYYFDQLGAEKMCLLAAETSENLAWAWVDVPWNDRAGPVAEKRPVVGESGPVAEGQPLPPPNLQGVQEIRAGDVEVRFYLPTDVAFEYDARGDLQWLILRRWVNKYDLAAEAPTPELAARIRAISSDAKEDRVSRYIRGWTKAQGAANYRSRTDEVAVLELRHMKTPGCPQGRWCRVVGGDIVLADGPARYVDSKGQDDLACYRIAAGEMYGTPRAYTSAHDALGLQRVVDTLTSVIHSNQAGLGTNTILNPEGNGLRPEDLRKGLLALHYSGGKDGEPKRLDLAHTDAQVLQMLDKQKASVDAKMGMDDQSMGRGPLPSSGSLALLIDDKTQRSVSGLAKAYNELRREVATGILRRFAQFGQYSRTLPLTVGKSQRTVMGSFSKKELGGIDRVTVESAPSMMRTATGRQAVAQLIIEAKGQNMPVEPLITFLETGKWEPLIEDEHAEMLTIREENERLLSGEALEPAGMDGAPLPMPTGPDGMSGTPVVSTAMFTDHPLKHILGHRPVLASPAARKNAVVVANAGAHMMAHVRILMQWVQGDPLLLALHGPPPQMPMPAGLPGGAPGPDGSAPKPDGGGGPAPSGPPEGGAREAQRPTNPKTGAEWSPTGEVANG